MEFLINNRNKIIPLLIVGTLVTIFTYDYILVDSSDASISVSEWIDCMSHTYPAIPFMFGFLCGHLFFSIPYKRKKIEID